jgi:nitrite reductase/ring-hydroxylating ferredoxin subunit
VLFDIEDFGIKLSAGITCSKHGWSFDLHSGKADHGRYILGRWDVELRPVVDDAEGEEKGEEEQRLGVWVRRKQRIG